MKLIDWAAQTGISYKTALRWFHAGLLPVKAQQLPTGTILVEERPITNSMLSSCHVALYARVSGADQKNDLDAQLGRLVSYASEHDLLVIKTVTEIGSGLNTHRPRLMKLLMDPNIPIILVEHRDRLMRFGSEYVEAALQAQGRKLRIVEEGELKDDLAQDLIDVLTSFCARLYGRRSARHRAQKAFEAARHNG